MVVDFLATFSWTEDLESGVEGPILYLLYEQRLRVRKISAVWVCHFNLSL